MGKRRGRPEVCRPWLTMATLAVRGYDKEMIAGEKHSEAVKDAVRYVQQRMPGIPVSETEIKRILAYWRPKGESNGLCVSKPDPANCTIALHDGRTAKVLLTAAFGLKPVYPRTNAKATRR